MSNNDLGGGIALDDDFDFEVDETGDIRKTTGRAELEKDIAYATAYALQAQLGQRVDGTAKKQVELIVRNVLIEEVRITDINRVNVIELPELDGYEIATNADSDAGPVELVFEVNL